MKTRSQAKSLESWDEFVTGRKRRQKEKEEEDEVYLEDELPDIDDLVDALDRDLDALTKQYKRIKGCGNKDIENRYLARIYNELIKSDPKNIVTVRSRLVQKKYDVANLTQDALMDIGREAAKTYFERNRRPPEKTVGSGSELVNAYTFAEAARCIDPAIVKILGE